MSLRTSLCPFPQKEQDRLPWWWLSFLLMSPPLHASVRGQREGRQPRFWAHVVPLSESIDVRPVTPETRRRRAAGGRPHASTTRGAHGRARARRHASAAVGPGGPRTDSRTASRRSPTLSPGRPIVDVAMDRLTYAMKLAYDGTAFRGWQRQPGLPTVQQAMEDAIASLLGERVQVHGAARTDAGVHAEGQVASFAVRRSLPPGAWYELRVPDRLRIVAASPARPGFHARSSARGKRYRYRFAAGGPLAWDLGRTMPDWDRARAALLGRRGLPHLPGLASPSRGSRPAPPLDEWSLSAEAEMAELTIRAPAFRKHQSPNPAGPRAPVTPGAAPPESVRQPPRGVS